MTDHDMEKKIEQLKAEIREREALSERELEAEIRASFRKAGIPLREKGYHFILEGEEVREVDAARWSAWFERHFVERIIARTVVHEAGTVYLASAEVSTVFLGLNHNWFGTGPPILFETMVFGGLLDGEMDRYATLADARAGHWAMVERVKRAEAGESL